MWALALPMEVIPHVILFPHSDRGKNSEKVGGKYLSLNGDEMVRQLRA